MKKYNLILSIVATLLLSCSGTDKVIKKNYTKLGKRVFNNGWIYEGALLNNFPNGEGKLRNKSLILHNGHWYHGYPTNLFAKTRLEKSLKKEYNSDSSRPVPVKSLKKDYSKVSKDGDIFSILGCIITGSFSSVKKSSC